MRDDHRPTRQPNDQELAAIARDGKVTSAAVGRWFALEEIARRSRDQSQTVFAGYEPMRISKP